MVWVGIIGGISFSYADVPSFDDNFAKYLVDGTPDEYWRKETVFDMCIDRTKTLKENMYVLFYPYNNSSACSVGAWGLLWNIIKVVGLWLLILCIILSGVKLLTNPDNPDKVKEATRGFIYIAYWAFLLFGAVWLLGSNVLNIANLSWTQDLVDKLQWWQNSLFFQILSFFKVLAFFVAILMLVYYWFRIISAMDQEEKIKEGRKWIVNVLIALVVIKVIDYTYYIAQMPEFTQKAADMVLEVAKVMAYILGAAFVLALFYSGFLLLTGGGNDEQFAKAKKMLWWIFLWAIVLFLFLLIIYQILAEFVPA